MSNIRHYIKLVEQAQNEAFAPAPRPTFGRRGVEVTPPQRSEPQNPETRKELERCREHRTANSYAMSNNRYLPIENYDPPRIKQMAEAETARLMARWNHWNELGLLGGNKSIEPERPIPQYITRGW